MPTGGLAPMPIRLGGTPEAGWAPEEHARLAIDVASCADLLPLALVEIIVEAAGASVHRCLSRGGDSIVASAPYYSQGLDAVSFDLAASYVPPGGKMTRGWAPRAAKGTVIGRQTVGFGGINGNRVGVAFTPQTVYPFTVWIAVYGDVEAADPHDYGADEDKRAAAEGEEPYAATELRGLESGLGSAYSKRLSSLVSLENVAIARALAVIPRCAERYVAGQSPTTAGQALGRWSNLFNVPQGLGELWKIRERCSRKARFAASSGVDAFLEPELRRMFGDAFVRINRFPGTIDTPPYPTFWPAGDPGPRAWDLGEGVWSSRRCHLQVQLKRGGYMSDDELVYVAKTELADMFSWALDSTTTWDWTLQAPGGFILGTSVLGRDSL